MLLCKLRYTPWSCTGLALAALPILANRRGFAELFGHKSLFDTEFFDEFFKSGVNKQNKPSSFGNYSKSLKIMRLSLYNPIILGYNKGIGNDGVSEKTLETVGYLSVLRNYMINPASQNVKRKSHNKWNRR